ncbi:serine hydrolase [Streptomyces sp. NBC_01498]|uniref:serine hydrolase n=1 Tax=Streptomyces sp. NBC_01498 TaxID=2975870 RepID=UPI002E7BD02C|nr:serine hydrolase [Streptomyces sp. NBC_01498]WTL23221.1 serine hydrolase [Streptomyces sp. NBC_01498]
MFPHRRLPRIAVPALALVVAVTVPGLATGHAPDAAPARAGTAPTGPGTAVREALDKLPHSDGRYTVAVRDLDGRHTAAYGTGSAAYDTASIVKVDILASLLLKAQDHGTSLTAAQKKQAAQMIRRSDNAATDALWKALGGTRGLDAANKRLGLKDTHGDPDGHWGLTRTTAADQATLLEAVLGDAHSPLTASSRAHVRSLMSTVVPEQRWGISAADDRPGSAAAPVLKNGWLPRSATGKWDVNSIGRVERGGHTLLVVVLSDGQRTYREGVDLVERAATTAVKAFVTAEKAQQP